MIMIGVVVTSLIVNVHLHAVINQLNAVNNQLNNEISGIQTQIQDLQQILGLQYIEFQTIEKGYTSGHKNSTYYVIENESAWAVVWNQHQSDSATPQPPLEIDFSKTIIIAVFMGEFPTRGNYEIEIKEVIDTPQCAIVKVEKMHPFNSGGWPATSQPYHMIKMRKVDKEITVETVEKKQVSMSQLHLINYESTVYPVWLGIDYVTVKGTIFNSGNDSIQNIFLHIRIYDGKGSLLETKEISLGTIAGKSYKNFDADIEAEGANSVTLCLGIIHLD